LLGVIGDIWTEAINNTTEMTIATLNDLRHGHSLLQRKKSLRERGMKQLAPKFSKFSTSRKLLLSYNTLEAQKLL
jgi:hypothetical protein